MFPSNANENKRKKSSFHWIQFSSVAQSCPTLQLHELQHARPPYHQRLESTQTHVHWVGDAIQSSHPLSSPSPPALNPSQHQGLFQSVSSLHYVAKVLEFQLQYQSFQWITSLNTLQWITWENTSAWLFTLTAVFWSWWNLVSSSEFQFWIEGYC